MMNAMTRELTEPLHVSVVGVGDDGESVAYDVDLPAGPVADDAPAAVLAAVDDFIANRDSVPEPAVEPDTTTSTRRPRR